MNLYHLMNHCFNILFDAQDQYVAMETWVSLVINALFFPTQEFEYCVIPSARIKLAIIHLKIASARSKKTHRTNDVLSSHKLFLNYDEVSWTWIIFHTHIRGGGCLREKGEECLDFFYWLLFSLRRKFDNLPTPDLFSFLLV